MSASSYLRLLGHIGVAILVLGAVGLIVSGVLGFISILTVLPCIFGLLLIIVVRICGNAYYRRHRGVRDIEHAMKFKQWVKWLVSNNNQREDILMDILVQFRINGLTKSILATRNVDSQKFTDTITHQIDDDTKDIVYLVGRIGIVKTGRLIIRLILSQDYLRRLDDTEDVSHG